MSKDRTFIDFSLLPKEEVRVLIAKDVLKQLEMGKLIAQKGKYLKLDKVGISNDEMLHDVLEDNKCTSCAVGALFYSRVQLANGIICKDMLWEPTSFESEIEFNLFHEEIIKYFDTGQLGLIELFFEGSFIGSFISYAMNDLDNEIKRNLYKFHEKYGDPDARMIAIMTNIAENDGTFVPSKLQLA